MLDHVPPSNPRFKEIVAAYNSSKPQGFRALPESGPPKKKKHR